MSDLSFYTDEKVEQQLIGVALTGQTYQRAILFDTEPDYFSSQECTRIFRKCKEFYEIGAPYGLAEVDAALKNDGFELPLSYLPDNLNECYGTPEPLIQRLQDLRQRRKFDAVLEAGRLQLSNGSAPAEVWQSIHKAKPDESTVENQVFIPTWDNRPPQTPAILELNGNRIGSPGNLSLIVAGPGAGKSALCECVLAGKLNPEADTFGIRVYTHRPILYLDTERSKGDHWQSFSRTMRRAGIVSGSQTPGIHFELIAMLPNIGQRRARLNALIRDIRPGLVILDGLGDFVLDPNDPLECNAWIFEIMALSKQNEFGILATIHPNPGDTVNRKARGHLGSEAMRRAESVLLLSRDTVTNQRTLTMDFANGKNRNAGDNLETYFSWDEMTQMFLSCPDGRTEKPAAREKYTEIAETLAGQSYTFSELIGRIAEITGKPEAASKSLYQRMKGKGFFVQDGQLWRVSSDP